MTSSTDLKSKDISFLESDWYYTECFLSHLQVLLHKLILCKGLLEDRIFFYTNFVLYAYPEGYLNGRENIWSFVSQNHVRKAHFEGDGGLFFLLWHRVSYLIKLLLVLRLLLLLCTLVCV